MLEKGAEKEFVQKVPGLDGPLKGKTTSMEKHNGMDQQFTSNQKANAKGKGGAMFGKEKWKMRTQNEGIITDKLLITSNKHTLINVNRDCNIAIPMKKGRQLQVLNLSSMAKAFR